MAQNYGKILLSSALGSLLILLALYITTGIYFESYEKYVDQFFVSQYSNTPDWWYAPQHVGLNYLYSCAAKAWPSIPVYSLANFLYLHILLTALISGVRILLGNAPWKTSRMLVVGLAMFLLLIDNLVFVNNVRIGLLIVFSSYLWLYVINRNKLPLAYYGVFFALSLLGFCIRMEMHLVISALALAIFALSSLRREAVVSMVVLCLGLLLSLLINDHISNRSPAFKVIHDSEHVLYHASPTDMPKNDGSAAFYRQMALMMYIQDPSVVDLADYEEIAQTKTTVREIFSAKFMQNYIKKLHAILWSSQSNIHLFLVLMVFIILLGVTILKGKRTSYLRAMLWCLIFLTVPLVINLFYLTPERFVSAYLSVFGLTMIMIYLARSDRGSYILVPMIVLLIAAMVGMFALRSSIQEEGRKNDEAASLKACLEQLQIQNRTAVISSCQWPSGDYDSKLFSYSQSSGIAHYYIDFFYYTTYDFFSDFNHGFFGAESSSLEDRLRSCIDRPEVVFLSNDEYNDFLSGYMASMHDLQLSFHPTDDCRSSVVRSYEIVMDR